MSNSWDALTPYRYFPRWIAYTEIEACETTLPKADIEDGPITRNQRRVFTDIRLTGQKVAFHSIKD